jgi:hypothetical protein
VSARRASACSREFRVATGGGERLGGLCRLSQSLGVADGDELFAIRTPDGIRLTPYDPDFAVAIESTRDYMRRHRDALHELAKR